MRLFECQRCGQRLYFENVLCERCGRQLGYLPDRATLSALEPASAGWTALAAPGELYRFCANAYHGVCNWLVPTNRGETLCAACRHNRTIPDLSIPENVARWQRLEGAKHRLFYTLSRLGLPTPTRDEDPDGLVFDFLADPPAGAPKVVTGHDSGLITISLVEADDAEREKLRQIMGEPYRTLLGHFRHEVGHFYWERLVRDGGELEAFRSVFGDERPGYQAALKAYYAQGAPADWQSRYISAYASAHPWEDFAETWAHYLHIVDTLEMARAFGLKIEPGVAEGARLEVEVDFDPHRAESSRSLIDAWLPLTFAVNSLNRCMGQDDLYPFVLAPAAIDKLGYVHDLIRRRQADL
jgi:hypothetical protein